MPASVGEVEKEGEVGSQSIHVGNLVKLFSCWVVRGAHPVEVHRERWRTERIRVLTYIQGTRPLMASVQIEREPPRASNVNGLIARNRFVLHPNTGDEVVCHNSV